MVDEDKNLGDADRDRETERPVLLPCPFCGSKPHCQLVEWGTIEAKRSYTGQPINMRVYKIGCVNETCAVRPEVSGGLAGVEIVWNTRH